MAMHIIGILVLLTFIEVNSDQCENNGSNQCDCYHAGDYEFQCPRNNYNYLIHGIPDQELRIECSQLENFNIDLLPNYKAGDNISLQLISCPLPENNYLPLLRKFDIASLNSLILEKINTPDSSPKQNVTKNIFDGLSGLKELTLTYVNNSLDDDFLDGLPNLLSLELDHSKMDISSLKFPQSLRILHLTGNSISNIPDGIFRNLSRLYQLHLWSNKITHINKESFVGLHKLTSLELSTNSIQDIEKGSFDNLENLKTINLGRNKISKISEDIFKYNINLTSIRMEENPNLILPDYVFANFPNLNSIKLKHSGIVTLPEHIFSNSTNIKTILLQDNRINDLPENVFNGLTGLEKLDLSNNKLDSLPKNIFLSLKSLMELNLSINNISKISEDLFKNTQNLKILKLSSNRISSIEYNSFYNLKELTDIDLSNNLWQTINGQDPFNYCHSLKTMILSNNLIESFPDITVLLYIEEIDLSYNKLKTFEINSIVTSGNLKSVKLTNNEITVVDFENAYLTIKENSDLTEEIDVDLKDNPLTCECSNINSIVTSGNLKSVKLTNNEITVVDFENAYLTIKENSDLTEEIDVDLKDNPLTCECSNVDLISYLQGHYKKIRDRVRLRVDGIHCSQPKSFQHILITYLKPEQVSCEIRVKGCPEECKSFWRPYTKFAVFDCSNRNLTNFPRISTDPQNIELNLTGNYIRGGLNSSLGYEYVKHLFLSKNQLQELKWIPAGIEKLTLDSNELTLLDPQLLKIMNKTALKTLKLSDNPWSCGCSALEFQIFIHDNFEKINSTEVICRDDNKPLIEKRQLCKPPLSLILSIVLPILSFLLLAVMGLVFYIYYRQEVKVWLFSKNLCLWFVSEEELDEDKIYDIFICYSHKDEDFVIQNLLPVLESGPNPFKICIHVRDFEPGELILTNVMNSITNSRRTLVILSNNFLESVWGIVEFKTAHMKTLEEGRTRLVVVKYGDLDEKRLDDDLNAYLNTNTYIEWGKPWFWNRLKYALPHSHKSGFYKSNQKHANVMLKIDDKFELTSPPLKHPESTPPVANGDPKHPLTFDNVNAESNRNSDVPFVVNA